MMLDDFTVHDLADFPVVRMRRVWPGYASQWETEMNALMAQTAPFVVIFDDRAPAEVHEDRRVRGLWLKRNKTDLGKICRAVIAVEADPVTRMAMQAQALAAGKAFGLAMVIASSVSEAEEKARELLYGDV